MLCCLKELSVPTSSMEKRVCVYFSVMKEHSVKQDVPRLAQMSESEWTLYIMLNNPLYVIQHLESVRLIGIPVFNIFCMCQ